MIVLRYVLGGTRVRGSAGSRGVAAEVVDRRKVAFHSILRLEAHIEGGDIGRGGGTIPAGTGTVSRFHLDQLVSSRVTMARTTVVILVVLQRS
ncbi:hypothetical protein, partial [Streptomyces sp. NPDC000983]|uniref:hypothetical protein n=1 Tax=Streptomyces sp. NPDC000983 TaxID=3154373 RepID=UPI003328C00B